MPFFPLLQGCRPQGFLLLLLASSLEVLIGTELYFSSYPARTVILYTFKAGDIALPQLKAGWCSEIFCYGIWDVLWTVPWPQLLGHHCCSILDVSEVPLDGKPGHLPCLEIPPGELSSDSCAEDQAGSLVLGRMGGHCRSLCRICSHLQHVCCQLGFLFTLQFVLEQALKQPRWLRTQPAAGGLSSPRSLWGRKARVSFLAHVIAVALLTHTFFFFSCRVTALCGWGQCSVGNRFLRRASSVMFL